MMTIQRPLQKNLSLILQEKEGMSHKGKIIYEKFHAPYFGAANLIVWKFYIETGTVHVCTGSYILI